MKKTILSILMMSSITLLAQTMDKTKEKKDMDFVNDAAQAGLLEVKLGELAKSNASSEDVKKLAEHMVADHTKAGNELTELVSKKSITAPNMLDKEGQKHYD